jgi:hypothetical protein
VLPFDDFSRDAGQEWFANGLAEESRTWPGRAAAAFSAGDFERGLELVEAYELGSPSLRKAHFYFWNGDMAGDYLPAQRLAAQASPWPRLPDASQVGGLLDWIIRKRCTTWQPTEIARQSVMDGSAW